MHLKAEYRILIVKLMYAIYWLPHDKKRNYIGRRSNLEVKESMDTFPNIQMRRKEKHIMEASLT